MFVVGCCFTRLPFARDSFVYVALSFLLEGHTRGCSLVSCIAELLAGHCIATAGRLCAGHLYVCIARLQGCVNPATSAV
jgi:hypothetical protein